MTTQTEEAINAVDAAKSDNRCSVVAKKYKIAYAERAVSARGKKGVSKCVVADSCGDWLRLELAAKCRPSPKAPMDVAMFDAILEANGVHVDVDRTRRFWQGRLSMNGSQALRAVVAECGHLVFPNGDRIEAPRVWCARWIRK